MSELKCPICGQELKQDYYDCEMLECHNPKCKHYYDSCIGREELWQALIQAKQDLEIARKALKTTYARGFTKSEAVGILQRNNMTISKALEQIEHKE